LNPIKALKAEGYFFRHSDRDNSVVECKTLKPAEPRLNLAFGQVVDGVQQ
jgi:hypothetical protein